MFLIGRFTINFQPVLFLFLMILYILLPGISSADQLLSNETQTEGTLSISVSQKFSPLVFDFSENQDNFRTKLEPTGHRISINPGIRIFFKNEDNTKQIGYIFAETPISLYTGTYSDNLSLSQSYRTIDTQVSEIGLGFNGGISFKLYKRLSVMGGIGLEMQQISCQVQEYYHDSSTYVVNQSKITTGTKLIPMLGVSVSVSSVFEVALVANFTTYSNEGCGVSTSNDVDGSVVISGYSLVPNERQRLDLKVTFLW